MISLETTETEKIQNEKIMQTMDTIETIKTVKIMEIMETMGGGCGINNNQVRITKNQNRESKNQNKDQKKNLWKWRRLQGLGLAGSRPRIQKNQKHGKLRKPANAAICSVGSIRSLAKAPKICHLQSWQFFQNFECCNLQCSWPFKSRTFCSLQYWLPFKNSKCCNLHHFYKNKIKKTLLKQKTPKKNWIPFGYDVELRAMASMDCLTKQRGEWGGRSPDVQR